ncbi:MAG: tetratricopeptide repeat protein [Ignavibacteria bacterium]|nr:tetratricopeptide repeat protein [Ignavibacteria bacterium]
MNITRWKFGSVFIFICGLAFFGCSSSEESMKNFTPPQSSVGGMGHRDNLRVENDSLKNAVLMLQQENSSLSAHVQQLSSQFSTPQERSAITPHKDIDNLQAENDSLKNAELMLRQENRSLATNVQQLTSQLSALQERLTTTSLSPQKSTISNPREGYVPAPTIPEPTISNSREGYEKALTLFRSKKYHEAASALQAVLNAGAPVPMQDNCHYWLGECSYAMRQYDDAIEHFQKVFAFDRSQKKDDAQMMIANSYLAKGDRAGAKAEFEKLIKKFPASPFVKRAKAKLQRL